ncbi:MAG: DHH family phosphoesterase [Spirochaetaceae bacterium]|jgi:nanoRNase/pAp phosphatase (c-di-AMP/oligoRNAs hydrolase)|nr:DHH family phosphoesterase [Spirochaetaceae bacterium]
MQAKVRNKHEIKTITEKKTIAANIIDAMIKHSSFLIIGHENPDTDCVSAMAGFALLLKKISASKAGPKEAYLYLAVGVQEQFNYLLAICKYNGIKIIYGDSEIPADIDAIATMDTAKPSMLAVNESIGALLDNKDIRKIEVDHHLEGDAAYIGDEGYALVSEASSACELLGYLAYKLSRRPEFKDIDFSSRNIVLVLLTGIVGDSRMGRYLKSNKERWYYKHFSKMFDHLLVEKTYKGSNNLASMEAVFEAVQRFSVGEKKCFDFFHENKKTEGPLGYVFLDKAQSDELFERYHRDDIVFVARTLTDSLVDESGKYGAVAYIEADNIQFRIRRNAKIITTDLRQMLKKLDIKNGGGHPGAIAFKIPLEGITDVKAFYADFVKRIVGCWGE